MIRHLSVAAGIGLGLLAGCVSAAGPGRVEGLVYDASTRSLLAGALVGIVGTEYGVAAESDGSFEIADLPAGIYSVEASQVGYRSQVKTEVTVLPGRSTELAFYLETDIIELSEVTIHPDYFPKVKDAPVSERAFSADEIQSQPAGNGDIQRVVQTMPAVVSTGDQDNEIVVRGGNSNENLFLLDGIEIPFPNHFGSFGQQGGAVNMLNALVVRDVAFVAGAFPAKYGDRASSVTDISLKRGSCEHFSGNLDMGMVGFGAVVEGPLPGRAGSFIGTYHKSFLELMAASGVWGGLSAVPYYDNFLGKVSLKLPNAGELSLLGMYGADHITMKPGQYSGDPNLGVRSSSSHLVGGIGWQTLFGDRGYGKLLVSGVQSGWDQFVTFQSETRDTMFTMTNREGALTARYDASLTLLAGHETQAGVSLARVPYDYSMDERPDTTFHYRYNPDGSILDSSFARANPQLDVNRHVAGYKGAFHVQHRLPLGNIAHLTAGLRGDHFSHTGHSYLSPRFGLATRPLIAGFSLNAGYGWHRQSPPGWVFVYDSVNNHYLESERSDHVVLGIERQLDDDIKLSAEGYYKNVRNSLVGKHWTTPDSFDWSPTVLDIGRGTARGIEFFLQKKFGRNWYGTVAYALSESRTQNPLDTLRTMPGNYDSRHILTAVGSYQFEFHKYYWYQGLPGWFRATVGGILFSDVSTLGARFRYVSGRPRTPQEWDPTTRRWVINGYQLNSARFPDYSRLDLRLDHKFLFSRWSITAYAEVQNVLNRQNVYYYAYTNGDPNPKAVNQVGRWLIGGLTVSF